MEQWQLAEQSREGTSLWVRVDIAGVAHGYAVCEFGVEPQHAAALIYTRLEDARAEFSGELPPEAASIRGNSPAAVAGRAARVVRACNEWKVQAGRLSRRALRQWARRVEAEARLRPADFRHWGILRKGG